MTRRCFASQKEEFQLCDMENENQILLEKMSYIFRTPPLVDTHRLQYNVIKRWVAY